MGRPKPTPRNWLRRYGACRTTCRWSKPCGDDFNNLHSDNVEDRQHTTSRQVLRKGRPAATNHIGDALDGGQSNRPNHGAQRTAPSVDDCPRPGNPRLGMGPLGVGAITVLAVIYCLWVGDPESLCWEWLGTPGWFTFHDEKVNGQTTSYPLSDYMEQWRKHLYAQRRPNHRDFTRLFPGGRNAIRTLLQDLLANTPAAGLTWHPFKRCGAAAFIKMGGAIRGLAGWARWHSQKQARRYAAAPPAWVWPQQLHLPTPDQARPEHTLGASSRSATYGRGTPSSPTPDHTSRLPHTSPSIVPLLSYRNKNYPTATDRAATTPKQRHTWTWTPPTETIDQRPPADPRRPRQPPEQPRQVQCPLADAPPPPRSWQPDHQIADDPPYRWYLSTATPTTATDVGTTHDDAGHIPQRPPACTPRPTRLWLPRTRQWLPRSAPGPP